MMEKEKDTKRKLYYKEHREERLAYQRGHKEKQKEYYHRWYRKHREEIAQHRREDRIQHPKEVIAYQRHWVERRKRLLLTHYGNGKCACVKCGFSDIRALSIDHINAIGTRKKREVTGGTNFYALLIKNNYPKGYQTLCMNCQWIKRFENEEHGNRYVCQVDK